MKKLLLIGLISAFIAHSHILCSCRDQETYGSYISDGPQPTSPELLQIFHDIPIRTIDDLPKLCVRILMQLLIRQPGEKALSVYQEEGLCTACSALLSFSQTYKKHGWYFHLASSLHGHQYLEFFSSESTLSLDEVKSACAQTIAELRRGDWHILRAYL